MYALADSNQCIQLREKMLELSSTVLSTLSLYQQHDMTDSKMFTIATEQVAYL